MVSTTPTGQAKYVQHNAEARSSKLQLLWRQYVLHILSVP